LIYMSHGPHACYMFCQILTLLNVLYNSILVTSLFDSISPSAKNCWIKESALIPKMSLSLSSWQKCFLNIIITIRNRESWVAMVTRQRSW
jgi:hypothetical protein